MDSITPAVEFDLFAKYWASMIQKAKRVSFFGYQPEFIEWQGIDSPSMLEVMLNVLDRQGTVDLITLRPSNGEIPQVVETFIEYVQGNS